MASPKVVAARGAWRTWTPEQRKKKQEKNRVSKRNVDQIREDCIRDLESRLWCVIERLGSVETEVERLRDVKSAFELGNEMELFCDTNQFDIWVNDVNTQDLVQCSIPSEVGPNDLHWTQDSQDALSWIDTDGFIFPIPGQPAMVQPAGFVDELHEILDCSLPITDDNFANLSHLSDPNSAEILQPDGIEITQEFNEVIAMVHTLNATRRVRKEHDINEDFLIRAVFEGWQSVFRFEYARTCPLWSILCRVDKVLYENCSVALRLAHLRVIYRMFMFIMFKKPVPKWFTPKAKFHQYAPSNSLSTADFIVQPEIRDHLGLQKKPLTNDFWNWFSQTATFNCPLEPAELYYESEGLYRFSGAFTNHFEELGNWNFHDAMKMRFPAVFGQVSLTKWSLEPPRCDELVDYQNRLAGTELLGLVDCTAGFGSEFDEQNVICPSEFSFT